MTYGCYVGSGAVVYHVGWKVEKLSMSLSLFLIVAALSFTDLYGNVMRFTSCVFLLLVSCARFHLPLHFHLDFQFKLFPYSAFDLLWAYFLQKKNQCIVFLICIQNFQNWEYNYVFDFFRITEMIFLRCWLEACVDG